MRQSVKGGLPILLGRQNIQHGPRKAGFPSGTNAISCTQQFFRLSQ
jgi:hypothetical protein